MGESRSQTGLTPIRGALPQTTAWVLFFKQIRLACFRLNIHKFALVMMGLGEVIILIVSKGEITI